MKNFAKAWRWVMAIFWVVLGPVGIADEWHKGNFGFWFWLYLILFLRALFFVLEWVFKRLNK